MNNLFLIIGRLTKDIELYTNENNVASTRFNIAVNRTFKNAEGNYDTDFINCVAYRETAERLAKFCHKGDLLGIKGSIRTGSYEKDGETKYTQNLVVGDLQFLSNKKTEEKEIAPEEKTIDPYEEFGNQVELTDEDSPF